MTRDEMEAILGIVIEGSIYIPNPVIMASPQAFDILQKLAMKLKAQKEFVEKTNLKIDEVSRQFLEQLE